MPGTLIKRGYVTRRRPNDSVNSPAADDPDQDHRGERGDDGGDDHVRPAGRR